MLISCKKLFSKCALGIILWK